METKTWFEIMPADTDGAVLISHRDPYGKLSEIWITREIANKMAQAIIADRMK